MKKIALVLGFTGILFLSGCGGSGGGSSSSGGGGTPVIPKESPIIRSSDAPRNINIPYGERMILGGGSLTTQIYDANGEKIYKNTNEPISALLSAGDYVVSVKESTQRYDDSEGVIFYLSSNIGLEDLPLNSTIAIPKRSARIYQLNVEYENMYLIDTSRVDMHIYNSSLNQITEVLYDDTITLTPGIYYFVADTDTFILEGKFSVTPI